MLRHALEAQGHFVLEARDEPEALHHLQQSRPAVVLTDLKLPTGDGFGVLRAAKELDPELQVVVMTAFGSIQDAVTAMKQGAMDFLAKPVDPDHLNLMVERAIAQRRMLSEYVLLKEELAQRRGAPRIIGEDPQLRQVSQQLHRAAQTDATVLLEGESGTGKELFARALHALSPRADGPFVAINCAAIPDTLLETELFGHEKGAFTGAVGRKPGRFEMAHRGTLFLDEIGDLPLGLQAKILRALETKQFERVGGTSSLHVDARVVAATNRQLKARVAARQFREDLYLPVVGVPDYDPSTSGARPRHPDAGAPFRRKVLPRSEQAGLHTVPGGARQSSRLRVARKRPRAAELHRTRGHSVRRGHNPAQASQPHLPRCVRHVCVSAGSGRRNGPSTTERPIARADRSVGDDDGSGEAGDGGGTDDFSLTRFPAEFWQAGIGGMKVKLFQAD